MESKHFSQDELECHCGCGKGGMEEHLMERLEALREICGFPFPVTSAFRCTSHNLRVGGNPHSKHLLGRAIDIGVSGHDAFQLLKTAINHGWKGIGISQSATHGYFIHLDTRDSSTGRVWTY
jgi:uncharacterized protein YcbK (DUF882 family)